MKLTIINIDKAVYVDGKSFVNLDLPMLPLNLHALQWKDNKGYIEYNDGTLNKEIDSLPLWANQAYEIWKKNNDLEESLIPIKAPLTDSQKLDLIRMERNIRLAETDWTQLTDTPSNVDKAAWATYRQALRDLPDNTTNLDNVFWPIPPA